MALASLRLASFLSAAINTRFSTPAARNVVRFCSNSSQACLHQSFVSSLGKQSRGIPVKAENVEILDTPSRFYEELKRGVRNSSNRIELAALYIGLGPLEQELLHEIADAVAAKPSLRASLLFDALRSTRPTQSATSKFSRSSEMLSELLMVKCRNAQDRLQVSLYQTPDLNKVLKRLLPPRVNEVVGVCHLKAYVFDDDVLISGANLSENYFTNRQDRYVWFKQSKQLADYFSSLIEVVSSFSYKLDREGQIIPRSSVVDPLEDPVSFRVKMAEKVNNLVSASAPDKDDLSSGSGSLTLDGTSSSTWVFPTIQMGPLGIEQDELCTRWLLRNLAPESQVHLASAYFNLTPEMERVVLETSKHKMVNILTAAPEANGFYGASGFSGFIPHAYSLLEKSLYKRGRRIHSKSNKDATHNGLRIHEYKRPGWTFHAKGLWCSVAEETSITLIGSSNFGYRSRHRDLEAQLLMITMDPQLRTQLEVEKNSLYSFAAPVVDSSFSEQGRVDNVAASIAARVIRSWL